MIFLRRLHPLAIYFFHLVRLVSGKFVTLLKCLCKWKPFLGSCGHILASCTVILEPAWVSILRLGLIHPPTSTRAGREHSRSGKIMMTSWSGTSPYSQALSICSRRKIGRFSGWLSLHSSLINNFCGLTVDKLYCSNKASQSNFSACNRFINTDWNNSLFMLVRARRWPMPLHRPI